MKLKVFAVYDEKACVYGTPFFMMTEAEATRAFKDLANDEKTTVGRHPSDFALFCLGTFDNEEGEFVGKETNMGRADDYKLRESEIPLGVKR